MKVVILCGGQGTRLREETEFRPKPMVEIGGRPMLWHIMKTYSHFGFKDFILCLGYKGDIIRQYFLNYHVLNSDFTIELGTRNVSHLSPCHNEHDWRVTLAETGPDTMTGGRARRIEPYIDSDTFMLTYGDGLADIDIQALLDFHLAMGCIATITGVRPITRFGHLSVKGNLADSFREKPQTEEGRINGGFFVFNRRIFDYLDGDQCVLEREPLERLAADGQLAVFQHNGYWRCMDTLRDVEVLNQEWAEGRAPWHVPERVLT